MTAIHTPVYLVTGGARRVGAAIVRTLHTTGASVVIHHRQSANAAQELAEELNQIRPNSATVVAGNLSVAEECGHVADVALARFGRLDGLVNNASSFFRTPLGEISEADWDDLTGSNMKGPLFLSQALAAALRTSRGAIVNITDIHAERPLAGYPVYCAAKAGLLALTRALAVELAPEVRVNAVAPGAIQWPDGGAEFTAEERDAILAHTLMKRLGNPNDIALTVKFLITDAPYITGQVINVDGGRTAHL